MTAPEDLVPAPLPPVATALQINLHPIDAAHAVHVLPHQLRCWSRQFARVLLSVDTFQTSSGRYKQPGFMEARDRLTRLLADVEAEFPGVVVDPVDFGEAGQDLVRRVFFPRLTSRYPLRPYDGGPFHVYFYGIARANARHVMHLDSDMLFGGGDQRWVEEATAMLAEVPEALLVAPLGGPPLDVDDASPRFEAGFGALSAEGAAQARAHYRLQAEPETWSYPTMSTRAFMIDMDRFADLVGSLDMVRPTRTRRLRARLVDQDPVAMPGEILISSNMISRGLRRLDFLGTDPGVFSLHPPYRSAQFYDDLPALIRRIEVGDIPRGQRGFYDINSSMHPWSEDVLHPRPVVRYRKAARQVIEANVARVRRGLRRG